MGVDFLSDQDHEVIFRAIEGMEHLKSFFNESSILELCSRDNPDVTVENFISKGYRVALIDSDPTRIKAMITKDGEEVPGLILYDIDPKNRIIRGDNFYPNLPTGQALGKAALYQVLTHGNRYANWKIISETSNPKLAIIYLKLTSFNVTVTFRREHRKTMFKIEGTIPRPSISTPISIPALRKETDL